MANKWKLECSHTKIEYEQYRCPVTGMKCYTLFEALALVDFYLECALVEGCELGKRLSDYGWSGKNLGKLEREIKKVFGVPNDQFLVAKTIKFPETLARFGFRKNEPICADCPRVALTIEFNVIEGAIRQKAGKTRVGCLLRHVRNSIAHGNTFLFPNDNLLLLDFDKNKNVTGFILVPAASLLEVKRIIEGGPQDE